MFILRSFQLKLATAHIAVALTLTYQFETQARDAAKSPGQIEEQARQLLQSKNPKQVIELLSAHKASLSRSGLITLAKAYGLQSDGINRISTLELCLAKNPDDYHVHKELGDAYLDLKRFDQAISSYRESIQLSRKYHPAHEALAQAYEFSKDPEGARGAYELMLEVFGPKPNYLVQLCRLYAEANFLTDALRVCNQSIRRNPKVPDSYVHLAQALRKQESVDRAARLVTQAARRFPASVAVQSMAGQVLLDKRDHQGARRYFLQAVQADPKSHQAQLGLAMAQYELQDFAASISAFTKACELNRADTVFDFRKATFKLKEKNDIKWYMKFQDGLERCQQ